MQNNVSTVATAGDSVVLPPAVVGLQIIVQNSAANSLNVFPASQAHGGASGGDKINALAQNAALAIASHDTDGVLLLPERDLEHQIALIGQ
jgi:hypothetical protein